MTLPAMPTPASPRRLLAATVCLTVLLAPGVARAYIDPGTGSYYVQVLVASIAGGMLALRSFWSRLFGRRRRTPADRHDDRHDDDRPSRRAD